DQPVVARGIADRRYRLDEDLAASGHGDAGKGAALFIRDVAAQASRACLRGGDTARSEDTDQRYGDHTSVHDHPPEGGPQLFCDEAVITPFDKMSTIVFAAKPRCPVCVKRPKASCWCSCSSASRLSRWPTRRRR